MADKEATVSTDSGTAVKQDSGGRKPTEAEQDTKIRYVDDEGKTQEREPEKPDDVEEVEPPESLGTDPAALANAVKGEGDNFDEESGFYQQSEDKGKGK